MGAFLAHDVSAAYNAEEHIFIPPHRTIGFNPQVKVDDALLLSEYLNDSTLSYEEASSLLENDITALHCRLSRKGQFRFGELGTFSMDIDGIITFEPCSNGIDDPKNFGFESLAIAPLSECKKKEIVIKRSDIGRYVAVAAAAILAFFFVTPISDSAYTPSLQASLTAFPKNNKTISTVMINAIASSGKEQVCEIAPVQDTTTENIITKETGDSDVQEVVDKKNDIAPLTNSPEVPTYNVAEQTNGKTFHIIVASSPNAKNAQLAIKELSCKMKADYNVVEGDRRFRISIAGYSNESDASSALVQIKKTFPDAWILTR